MLCGFGFQVIDCVKSLDGRRDCKKILEHTDYVFCTSIYIYDMYILHLLKIVQCNGVIYPVLMALIHGEPEPECF